MEKYRQIFEKMIERRWLVIGLIFLLALSLRAVRPFVVDRISTDGVLYVYMATDISEGNIDEAFSKNRRMPPLYLFMMVGLHKLGIHIESAGRLISIIAGALLIIPVYLISEMIFKSRLAALGAFLVAVNPDLVRGSARIMRDSLFLILLFSALYFIAKALKSEKWNLHFWSMAGIFVSLGVAVRTETIELIPIAIIWVIVELISLKRENKPILLISAKWALGFMLMISLYFITAIPFLVSLKETTSTWSIVDKRIPGYIKTFLKISKEDALKVEDTR